MLVLGDVVLRLLFGRTAGGFTCGAILAGIRARDCRCFSISAIVSVCVEGLGCIFVWGSLHVVLCPCEVGTNIYFLACDGSRHCLQTVLLWLGVCWTQNWDHGAIYHRICIIFITVAIW